jgi:hypothetical protein
MTVTQTLLDEMYGNSQGAPAPEAALEKTAEERFSDAMFNEEDYSNLSDEDLQQLESEISAEISEADPESSEALDKLASEQLMGRTALHAFLQEEKLIKLALANGLCRVCKEKPLDTDNHPTICAECLAG